MTLAGKACSFDGSSYVMDFTVVFSDGYRDRWDGYVSSGPYVMNLHTEYGGLTWFTVASADQVFDC